ncbi:MAG: preprotein translocase subunit SecG [Oscillospiraceae bacterium]|nr:preprotein translocase subunit SecG [Oscillospiraceae bacterium]
MTTAQIVLSIIYFIVALGLIAIVMLQSGKSAGLSGAISGGADTFLSKNKAKSADARLAKMTKWIAIVFLVLTLIICFVS